jgi:hypothetical protein
MPQNIPAMTLSATKAVSGAVHLQFIINGAIRFAFSIPSADFTSLNTTVNGGAGGTNITKAYAQDLNPQDYALGFIEGVI